MLSKPAAGWTEITVNNKRLGSASYLDWVPGLIIDACVRYLQAANSCGIDVNTLTGESFGFNIEFDAEGHYFGIVEIGERMYTYDTCGEDEPYIRLTLCSNGGNVKFVYELLKEAVEDIETDFDDWVMWDAVCNEDIEINKRALEDELSEAKNWLSRMNC